MNSVVKRFMHVGESTTTPVENTRRKELSVDVYVGQNGYVQNAGFTQHVISRLERGAIDGPRAIVMHRTVSPTARSTLNAWEAGPGNVGTHFLIDKDGTVYQTASLKMYTAHVGNLRARSVEEGTSSSEEREAVRRWERGGRYRAVHDHEKSKPYPQRFPMNEDSVGIEVVAMYDAVLSQWDPPTPDQSKSILHLVRILKKSYGLQDADVYEHDRISRKTPGEGAGLYDGDTQNLYGPPPVDSSLPGRDRRFPFDL